MPFLSQLLGRPTIDADGTRVGILRDLLISTDIPYPPMNAIVVGDKRHQHAIPWLHVASLTPRGAVLRSRVRLEAFPPPTDDLIWLGRDLLDKQIVDTHGVKLVRVNDLSLTPINGDLRLAGVDNSVAGLARRLGIEWLASLVRRGRPRLIDWEQVDIGPAVDEIRLKVPFQRLRRMQPADIGSIISQMSPGEAADVLEALDEETAADALAELSEEHQAAVVTAMEPEEAADVLERMAPDEAADILGDVHRERAGELMRLMEPHTAEEVRSLLIYEDDTAGGLMNSRLFAVAEMETAGRVIEDLRKTSPPQDEIYYLYVVDTSGRMRGVLSLRDLVVAEPDTLIVDCMEQDVAFVRLDDSADEVARKIMHYNLLAIPVVDEFGHLKGMVTVDDVVDLMTPRAWQNRPRRMTG
jgi:magnesium transporter